MSVSEGASVRVCEYMSVCVCVLALAWCVSVVFVSFVCVRACMRARARACVCFVLCSYSFYPHWRHYHVRLRESVTACLMVSVTENVTPQPSPCAYSANIANMIECLDLTGCLSSW